MRFNPEMMFGLVRHLLTFAGGYLVSTGHLTEPDAEVIIGAIVAIAGTLWSVGAKKTAPPVQPPTKGL
jgi:hypothetical protein